MVGNIDRVTGSGDISSESRSLQRVGEVVLRSIGDGEVVFGTEQSIVIEAEDNLLTLITTEVRDGTLYIGVEEGTSINPTRPIHYQITVGPVDRAEISGVGSLTIKSPSSNQLELSFLVRVPLLR